MCDAAPVCERMFGVEASLIGFTNENAAWAGVYSRTQVAQ